MNNQKIWDIANDDLVLISLSFEKIKATAISAHSYLNSVNYESSECTNTVMTFRKLHIISAGGSSSPAPL